MKSFIFFATVAITCCIANAYWPQRHHHYNHNDRGSDGDLAHQPWWSRGRKPPFGHISGEDYGEEGSNEYETRTTDRPFDGIYRPWNSFPEYTTERTLSREAIETCIRSCPVTNEYNPVCGSDNVTYMNPGRLECAQNCGVVVQLCRMTSCSSPDTGDGFRNTSSITTESTSIQTNTNTDDNGNGGNNETGEKYWNVGHNGNKGTNENQSPPSIDKIIACMQLCPITTKCEPVCGSDGVTYLNPGRLVCSQLCGIDVKAVRYGPCSSASGDSFQCPLSTAEETPANFLTLACSSCPTPPCPSCPTPTSLSCPTPTCPSCPTQTCPSCPAPTCSSCPTPTCPNCPNTNPPATEDPGRATTSPPKQNSLSCFFACPITSEYRPVCGTNNITYPNIDRLECSRRCGVDVSVLKMTRCTSVEVASSSITPPVWGITDRTTVYSSGDNSDVQYQDCLQRCPITLNYDPVCGTDDRTYINILYIECARMCGSNVQLKSSSVCAENPAIVSTESTPTGLDFTIPSDILNSLFPDAPATATPAAKPTTPDTKPTPGESGEFDVDERVKDE